MKVNRQCGDCQLCCKLLPVKGLNKGANERCRYQKVGKGCSIYHRYSAGFPTECGLWSCRWLVNDAGKTGRPDRTHYVIDVMPDFVEAREGDGKPFNIAVVQVWCDPKYPDAHHDPALREWLNSNRYVAMVRSSAHEGFVLFPPSRTQSHQWIENYTGSQATGVPHNAEDLFIGLSTAV